MSDVLQVTAEVLQKLAEYFDAVEHEKSAQVNETRQQMLEEIKAQVSSSSDVDEDSEVWSKLASADPDLLEAVSALVKQANYIDDMGEPGATSDEGVPLTVDEAANYAEQRLLEFCS